LLGLGLETASFEVTLHEQLAVERVLVHELAVGLPARTGVALLVSASAAGAASVCVIVLAIAAAAVKAHDDADSVSNCRKA
jgi:hypothetical protein